MADLVQSEGATMPNKVETSGVQKTAQAKTKKSVSYQERQVQNFVAVFGARTNADGETQERSTQK